MTALDVDPWMMDACERHTRRATRLMRVPTLPNALVTQRAPAPRLHLDAKEWRTGFLGERRERERPFELERDLGELVPQALLRDLFRPPYELGFIERTPLASTIDRGAVAAAALLRASRTREPLPRIEPAARTLGAYALVRKALYQERWQPLLGDDEPRRPVNV